MDRIDETSLGNYRRKTFRFASGTQLKNPEEALQFVEERGFIFFWPVSGFDLPSLWTAVAGDRPVPNEHDDPGHITWGWKDAMLDKKRWYYGKLIRKKATIVRLDVIPTFYALSDRVGDLDDYMLAYEDGRLTWEEKSVAEALLNHGALNTIELRQKALLSGTSSKSRFERALASLQSGLWILPVGVAEAGAWRYAFIYELFDRWYPDVVSQARSITRREAYKKLTSLFLDSVGVSTIKAIGSLFRWDKKIVLRALGDLAASDLAQPLDEDHWATLRLSE